MHSHLDIQVNGKSLVIPDDSSLSVEEKNPMFNDVTFFSYPMQIPVEGNREVLKNIAHRDSDMRAMDLEHADARIFADGLPLNHGQVITQDGSEIKDTFEFNIDAQQQSFSELIGDLECQDVDITEKRILIGEKIGKINYDYYYKVEDLYLDTQDEEAGWQTAPRPGSGMAGHFRTLENRGTDVMDAPQALGFSFPGKCVGFPVAEKSVDVNTDVQSRNDIGFYKPKVSESYINVWQPYPFPYCNGRMAYAHRDKKTNDDGTLETEGYVVGNKKGSQLEDYGQYWCLDADRQQSGICFYVLYFLDCLFEQLGVAFDNSELLEIEDFTRLCFVTTRCSYDSVETNQQLNSLREINEWLRSRNCGGQIGFSLDVGTPKGYGEAVYGEKFYGNDLPKSYDIGSDGQISVEEEYSQYPKFADGWAYWIINHRRLNATFSCTAHVDEMYANSGNFPNASVSDVIQSLENSFGIRFIYDPEKRIVTARLLRNIFGERKIKKFNGKVLSMIPVNEKITGVRVAFSAESDAKEQRKNVRDGVRDYDTDYDYVEFPEDRTIRDQTYVQIARSENVTANNMNVYIDMMTGNAYRIKINSEAEDTMTLKPTMFQVAQNKGVEEGDCSEQNKEYVREMISNFKPVPLNVINATEYNNDADGNIAPILAPFLDVDMEREYLKKNIQSVGIYDEMKQMAPMGASWINVSLCGAGFPNGMQLSCNMHLWLSENYDPTQTDNGNSPLQDIDWGLTLGVMRGPGTGYGYITEETEDVGDVEYASSEAISYNNFQTYLHRYLSQLMPSVAPYFTYQETLAKLSEPQYDDLTLIDAENLGTLTVGRLKQLINQMYSYRYDPQVQIRTSGGYHDMYYAYTGQLSLIHQFVINGRKTARNSMKWVLEEQVFPNMQMSSEEFKSTLAGNVANGTWPANEVIYEPCLLTYGQLNGYYEHFSFERYGKMKVVVAWDFQLESLIGYTYPDNESGSGSSATVTGSQIVHYDKNYDGFNNDKWRQTVGAYALTSDSMDLKGALFDYNSNETGIGRGERFSLQIRAYQQPEWADAPLCADDERDEHGNIVTRIRSRGSYDVFLRPYVWFLLHRKPFKVKVLTTVAQLLDIRNHWEDKYVLDGKVGFINGMKYNVLKATGVSEAELEFYSL